VPYHSTGNDSAGIFTLRSYRPGPCHLSNAISGSENVNAGLLINLLISDPILSYGIVYDVIPDRSIAGIYAVTASDTASTSPKRIHHARLVPGHEHVVVRIVRQVSLDGAAIVWYRYLAIVV